MHKAKPAGRKTLSRVPSLDSNARPLRCRRTSRGITTEKPMCANRRHGSTHVKVTSPRSPFEDDLGDMDIDAALSLPVELPPGSEEAMDESIEAEVKEW